MSGLAQERSDRNRTPRLFLSGEVKVGDLLTATTILISVIGILISWGFDRRMRAARDADEIRLAAATTLGELERFKKLSLSIYTEAQPVFVETAEIVAGAKGQGARLARVKEGRDFLWRRLSEIQNSILRQTIDERLDSGYTSLLAYYPDIRPIYRETLEALMVVHEDSMQELMARLERRVLSFAASDSIYQSAAVGNALRQSAVEIRAEHVTRLAHEMVRAENFLLGKIEAESRSLLDGAER